MSNIVLIKDDLNKLELCYINLYKNIRQNYIATDNLNFQEINYILDQLEMLINRLQNEIKIESDKI